MKDPRWLKIPDLRKMEGTMTHFLLKQHYNDDYDQQKIYIRNCEADIFMQTWPNTAGGFSEPGMCSGQMFIKEYTTVLKFDIADVTGMTFEHYGVFFGDKIAYIIDHPNERFFEDLRDRNMTYAYIGRDKYEYIDTEEILC